MPHQIAPESDAQSSHETIIILVFGSFPVSRTASSLSSAADSAFEHLDLNSACFEQHYVQDFRSLLNLEEFRSQLEQHGWRLTILSLSALTEEPPRTNVIWIETNAPACDDVLRQVKVFQHRMNARYEIRSALIVTAGKPGEVLTLSDSRIRVAQSVLPVPLWIDDGGGHPCRVQIITGSCDLQPTILAMLDHNRSSLVSDTAALAAESVRAPANLTSMMKSPGLPFRREIYITAPGCTALRTDEFLIVCPQPADLTSQPTPDATAESDELACEVYVKPEDFWNIHNQSGVYPHLAATVNLVPASQTS